MVGINILLQAHLLTFRRVGFIGEVQIAAAGNFVGVDPAALEAEFLEHTGVEWFVEKIYRIALDRKFRVFEERKIFDFGRILEVDEDADFLARTWFERAAKKIGESKCRKLYEQGSGCDSKIIIPQRAPEGDFEGRNFF